MTPNRWERGIVISAAAAAVGEMAGASYNFHITGTDDEAGSRAGQGVGDVVPDVGVVEVKRAVAGRKAIAFLGHCQ